MLSTEEMGEGTGTFRWGVLQTAHVCVPMSVADILQHFIWPFTITLGKYRDGGTYVTSVRRSVFHTVYLPSYRQRLVGKMSNTVVPNATSIRLYPSIALEGDLASFLIVWIINQDRGGCENSRETAALS